MLITGWPGRRAEVAEERNHGLRVGVCFEGYSRGRTQKGEFCWISIEGDKNLCLRRKACWCWNTGFFTLPNASMFCFLLVFFVCQFPSCEDITELVKVVLKISSPSADLTDLDTKSLLAMVTTENIHTAMDEKKTQLARKEKMVVNK